MWSNQRGRSGRLGPPTWPAGRPHREGDAAAGPTSSGYLAGRPCPSGRARGRGAIAGRRGSSPSGGSREALVSNDLVQISGRRTAVTDDLLQHGLADATMSNSPYETRPSVQPFSDSPASSPLRLSSPRVLPRSRGYHPAVCPHRAPGAFPPGILRSSPVVAPFMGRLSPPAARSSSGATHRDVRSVLQVMSTRSPTLT